MTTQSDRDAAAVIARRAAYAADETAADAARAEREARDNADFFTAADETATNLNADDAAAAAVTAACATADADAAAAAAIAAWDVAIEADRAARGLRERE